MEAVVNIKLETIEQVKDFVRTITNIDGEFDLISGKYVVDAKSILGIFSVDLSQNIQLRIKSEQENVLELIDRFIVN